MLLMEMGRQDDDNRSSFEKPGDSQQGGGRGAFRRTSVLDFDQDLNWDNFGDFGNSEPKVAASPSSSKKLTTTLEDEKGVPAAQAKIVDKALEIARSADGKKKKKSSKKQQQSRSPKPKGKSSVSKRSPVGNHSKDHKDQHNDGSSQTDSTSPTSPSSSPVSSRVSPPASPLTTTTAETNNATTNKSKTTTTTAAPPPSRKKSAWELREEAKHGRRKRTSSATSTASTTSSSSTQPSLPVPIGLPKHMQPSPRNSEAEENLDLPPGLRVAAARKSSSGAAADSLNTSMHSTSSSRRSAARRSGSNNDATSLNNSRHGGRSDAMDSSGHGRCRRNRIKMEQAELNRSGHGPPGRNASMDSSGHRSRGGADKSELNTSGHRRRLHAAAAGSNTPFNNSKSKISTKDDSSSQRPRRRMLRKSAEQPQSQSETGGGASSSMLGSKSPMMNGSGHKSRGGATNNNASISNSSHRTPRRRLTGAAVAADKKDESSSKVSNHRRRASHEKSNHHNSTSNDASVSSTTARRARRSRQKQQESSTSRLKKLNSSSAAPGESTEEDDDDEGSVVISEPNSPVSKTPEKKVIKSMAEIIKEKEAFIDAMLEADEEEVDRQSKQEQEAAAERAEVAAKKEQEAAAERAQAAARQAREEQLLAAREAAVKRHAEEARQREEEQKAKREEEKEEQKKAAAAKEAQEKRKRERQAKDAAAKKAKEEQEEKGGGDDETINELKALMADNGTSPSKRSSRRDRTAVRKSFSPMSPPAEVRKSLEPKPGTALPPAFAAVDRTFRYSKNKNSGMMSPKSSRPVITTRGAAAPGSPPKTPNRATTRARVPNNRFSVANDLSTFNTKPASPKKATTSSDEPPPQTPIPAWKLREMAKRSPVVRTSLNGSSAAVGGVAEKDDGFSSPIVGGRGGGGTGGPGSDLPPAFQKASIRTPSRTPRSSIRTRRDGSTFVVPKKEQERHTGERRERRGSVLGSLRNILDAEEDEEGNTKLTTKEGKMEVSSDGKKRFVIELGDLPPEMLAAAMANGGRIPAGLLPGV